MAHDPPPPRQFNPQTQQYQCVPKCNECQLCDENGVCLPNPDAECDVCTDGRCDGAGNCQALSCDLEFFDKPLETCPDQLVKTYIKVTCLPDCSNVGPVALTYEFNYPEGLDAWGLPASAQCPHDPNTYTVVEVTLFLGSGVEPRLAPYDVIINGVLEDATCSLPVSVKAIGPNLVFDDLEEAQEENPGGFLGVNADDDNNTCIPDRYEDNASGIPLQVVGENDLRPLTLTAFGVDPAGSVTMRLWRGGNLIRIYQNADRTGEITPPPPITHLVNELPKTYWVEGLEPSLGMRDVELRLRYDPPDFSYFCRDFVFLTVFEVDLDVDSNNDGTIDPDNSSAGTDDKIEDKALYPGNPACAPDFIGKWVWPNNDDSDGNGMSDNQGGEVNGVPIDDTLTINGQSELDSNDVVQLKVQAIQPMPPANWNLYLEIENPEKIRVFDTYTATGPAFMGPGFLSKVEVNHAKAGRTFGFEGVSPGTTKVALILEDENGQEVARDEVRLTVIGLEVTWEDAAGNQITEPNEFYSADITNTTLPPPGPFALGVKYFPDATAPGGEWKDDIRVRVRTIPPVPSVTAYLRSFDPDDPSANNVGNVVDSDLFGPDNRGGAGSLGLNQGITWPDGSFWIGFTVAHQPGDNHRVAATLKPASLDMLTDDNVPPSATTPATDDQVPLFIGNISPLFTVWRTLNVEQDSMEAEPTIAFFRLPDWDVVTIDAAAVNPGSRSTSLTVTSGTTISGNLQSSETHHYEGGELTISGLGQPLFVVGSGTNTLEINRVLTRGEIDCIIGKQGQSARR